MENDNAPRPAKVTELRLGFLSDEMTKAASNGYNGGGQLMPTTPEDPVYRAFMLGRHLKRRGLPAPTQVRPSAGGMWDICIDEATDWVPYDEKCRAWVAWGGTAITTEEAEETLSSFKRQQRAFRLAMAVTEGLL